jgi:hypothetical protein
MWAAWRVQAGRLAQVAQLVARRAAQIVAEGAAAHQEAVLALSAVRATQIALLWHRYASLDRVRQLRVLTAGATRIAPMTRRAPVRSRVRVVQIAAD